MYFLPVKGRFCCILYYISYLDYRFLYFAAIYSFYFKWRFLLEFWTIKILVPTCREDFWTRLMYFLWFSHGFPLKLLLVISDSELCVAPLVLKVSLLVVIFFWRAAFWPFFQSNQELLLSSPFLSKHVMRVALYSAHWPPVWLPWLLSHWSGIRPVLGP